MPVTDSPLRYPGGKTKMYSKVKNIIESVLGKGHRIYIEPYAGGAGLALKLLYKNNVDYIVLNDFDFHIYCFWKSCLYETEEICYRIEKCQVDLCEWIKQKNVYEYSEKYSYVDVGFATFFLNRCNVSGIIKGGPIGGVGQKGKYKINARFNKENLIKKIKKLSQYKNKIKLYNLDAEEFLNKISLLCPEQNVFLNIDPPYVQKGSMLYKNAYNLEDHRRVSEQVKKLQSYWIVTYDACDFIKELYGEYYIEEMTLNYSAGNTKSGNEYIIYSDRIHMENTND